MEDEFALRYVCTCPGVNSRAELVTLAPGLRSEQRVAPLAGGIKNKKLMKQANILLYLFSQGRTEAISTGGGGGGGGCFPKFYRRK